MSSPPGDIFLAVLTAARELPLNGPGGVFSVMDSTLKGEGAASGDSWDYWDWLSNMEELGFLRLDMARKKVSVERQFLCRSPSSRSEFYLCGARTPDFVETLSKLCHEEGLSFKVEVLGCSMPRRIHIKGNELRFQAMAERADVPYQNVPLSYVLATRDISLGVLVGEKKLKGPFIADSSFPCIATAVEGISECFSSTGITNTSDQLDFFSPTSLRYDGLPPSKETPYALGRKDYYGRHDNLYRMTPDGSVQVCTDIAKRYAKYFCLSRAGIGLGYDRTRRTVLVPKYCRLPLPLARALVLCRCSPPTEALLDGASVRQLGFSDGEMPFLAYQGVPQVIAELLGKRLNISFRAIYYNHVGESWTCKIR